MKLTRWERSWLPVLFSAFVDPDAEGVAATPEAVRFEEAIGVVLHSASFKGALGWRIGAALLMLSPLLIDGRFATLAGLTVAERNALAARAVSHKLFAIRGLCMFLKVTVGMTLFRDPALRARSNYDRRPDAPREAPRVRALPVVRATDDADAMKEAV
jgi:hypothetical protein